MTRLPIVPWCTASLAALLDMSGCVVVNDFGASDDSTTEAAVDGSTSGDGPADSSGADEDPSGTLGAEGGLPPEDDAIESWSVAWHPTSGNTWYQSVALMSDGTIMVVGNRTAGSLPGLQHRYSPDGAPLALDEPTVTLVLDDVCELEPGWSRAIGQVTEEDFSLNTGLMLFDRWEDEPIEDGQLYDGPHHEEDFERLPTTLACDGEGNSWVGIDLDESPLSIVAQATDISLETVFTEEFIFEGDLHALDYADGVLEIVGSDTASGDVLWHRKLPGNPPFAQIVLPDDVSGFDVRGDRALFVYTNLAIPRSVVEVYDLSGTLLHRYEQILDADALVRAQALGPSGEFAVVVTTDTGEDQLVVFDSSGEVDWSQPVPVTPSDGDTLPVQARDMAIGDDGSIVAVGQAPLPSSTSSLAWVARWIP